jgi:hypothetical protein
MRANPSLSLVLLVVLGGCRDESRPKTHEQLDIEVHRDPGVELADYASFEVILPTTMVDDSPPLGFGELEQPLSAALTEQLIDKGLRANVDGERAQLVINPLITVDEISQILEFYDVHFGWYWGYAADWAPSPTLPRGSLVIDVVDQSGPNSPSDDKLVYRGIARGLLLDDPEQIRRELGTVVWTIFADWPNSSVKR